MTERTPSVALPASGLAEEMIPLLRSHLGLPAQAPPPAAPAPPKPEAAILEFADKTSADAPARAPAPAKLLQLVLLTLDSERYGLAIESVQEILRVAPIARVPDAPRHIRGVMNVRGRLLPIVEVRAILGLAPLACEADSRVVMVLVRGRTLGLLVDRVSYVLSLPADGILPPPREVLGERADFVRGVAMQEDGIVILLDLEKTLSFPG
jgi:purine-binding chemotaxis protein CheW